MLLNFVRLVIFSLMFSVGLSLSVQHLLSVWRRPEVLARALLAIVILFPVMTFVLLRLPVAATSGRHRFRSARRGTWSAAVGQAIRDGRGIFGLQRQPDAHARDARSRGDSTHTGGLSPVL